MKLQSIAARFKKINQCTKNRREVAAISACLRLIAHDCGTDRVPRHLAGCVENILRWQLLAVWLEQKLVASVETGADGARRVAACPEIAELADALERLDIARERLREAFYDTAALEAVDAPSINAIRDDVREAAAPPLTPIAAADCERPGTSSKTNGGAANGKTPDPKESDSAKPSSEPLVQTASVKKAKARANSGQPTGEGKFVIPLHAPELPAPTIPPYSEAAPNRRSFLLCPSPKDTLERIFSPGLR